MGIDWSMLSKQSMPTGGVVAQLPASPSSVDSLAGGVMQGMLQGQQMQLNNQTMEMNDMKIGAAKQELKDTATLRAAYMQNEEQYKKVLQSVKGPQAVMEFDKAKADYNKVLAETAEIHANNTIKAPQVVMANKIAMGQITSYVSNEPPERQQKALDMMFSQLDPQMQQGLKQAGLDKWNETTQAMYQNEAIGAAADQAAAAEANKNAPESVKTAGIMADLQLKRDNGTISPREQKQLDVLEKNQAKGIQTSPSQQIDIQTTSDRLKETGKAASTAQQSLTTTRQMKALSPAAFAGRGSGVELKAKQFLEYIGMPPQKGTSATEAFNAVSKEGQLVAQTLLKGSSSDRDMEIVAQTGPQLDNTEKGRQLILSSKEYKDTMVIAYHSFLNAYKSKNNGSLDGADEGWNNFIQSRSDFNPKTLTFNSEGINRKAWESFLDPSYQAPAQEKPQTSTQPQYDSTSLEAEMKRRGLL